MIGEQAAVQGRALEERLAAYLESEGARSATVVVEDQLSGGWSVDTYAVSVAGRPLVLRVGAPDHPTSTNPANEARILPGAAAAGVPVPEVVRTEDDPSWLGGAFSLVTRMGGSAPNVWSTRSMDRLLANTTAAHLLTQMAELALAVARMPATTAAERPPSTMSMRPEDYTVLADVQRWCGALASTGRPRPLLELAGHWLFENAPADLPVAFQHQDFRLGNVLFLSDGSVSAVLDWEFAGAGDPRCDIGYAAQPYVLGRLLNRRPALGAISDPTTWLLDAFIERAPGLGSRPELRWFVALGIFKMAISLARIVDSQAGGPDGKAAEWLELPILSLTDDLIARIRDVG